MHPALAAELPVVPLGVQVGDVTRGAAPPPRPPAARGAAGLARLPGPRGRGRHGPAQADKVYDFICVGELRKGGYKYKMRQPLSRMQRNIPDKYILHQQVVKRLLKIAMLAVQILGKVNLRMTPGTRSKAWQTCGNIYRQQTRRQGDRSLFFLSEHFLHVSGKVLQLPSIEAQSVARKILQLPSSEAQMVARTSAGKQDAIF